MTTPNPTTHHPDHVTALHTETEAAIALASDLLGITIEEARTYLYDMVLLCPSSAKADRGWVPSDGVPDGCAVYLEARSPEPRALPVEMRKSLTHDQALTSEDVHVLSKGLLFYRQRYMIGFDGSRLGTNSVDLETP